MRGPLLSGALGSPITLRRLAALLGAHPPVAVIRSVWLAGALATELSVVAVIDRAQAAAAGRLLRKPTVGPRLTLMIEGEAAPEAGTLGAIVVEDLAGTGAGALALVAGQARLLRADGLLVAMDRTKDAAVEARLAGFFLGAGLTHVGQDRPKEGALLTSGRAPTPAVLAALAP